MAAKVNLGEAALLSAAPDRSILALDEALTAFSRVAARQISRTALPTNPTTWRLVFRDGAAMAMRSSLALRTAR